MQESVGLVCRCLPQWHFECAEAVVVMRALGLTRYGCASRKCTVCQ